MVNGYRVCFMAGHYGSGKTLLSVALAIEFWRKRWVDHIYSNMMLKGDFFEEFPPFIENACVIYDEAWQTLDSRNFSGKESQKWLGYLRKRKLTLLLPSAISVDIRFRMMMCQRTVQFGNFAWGYKWRVEDGMGKFGGVFWLLNPLKFGNAYDHKEEPSYERGEMLSLLLQKGVPVSGGGRDLVMDTEAVDPFGVESKKNRTAVKKFVRQAGLK